MALLPPRAKAMADLLYKEHSLRIVRVGTLEVARGWDISRN